MNSKIGRFLCRMQALYIRYQYHRSRLSIRTLDRSRVCLDRSTLSSELKHSFRITESGIGASSVHLSKNLDQPLDIYLLTRNDIIGAEPATLVSNRIQYNLSSRRLDWTA